MPVIRLRYDELETLTGVGIERIKERLPLLCADIERLEADYVDVEFPPNRPDLFSVEGVARALRQFLDIEPGLRSYKLERSGIEMVIEPSVLDVRPYIVCGVVRNVQFDSQGIESLMLLQEHLHRGLGRNRRNVSVGVHDLGKVKPPFRYLAVEPSFSFVPLDYEEEMSMAEILERHPKGIDYRYILEGKAQYPLILDSDGNVLSFPPIINGELTRVTESTRDLFIDVTGLNEHVSIALNIIAYALAERGGVIQSVTLRSPIEGGKKAKQTPDFEPARMDVSVEEVVSLLGIDLHAEDCKKCCERMGLGAEVKPGGLLEVQIPAYRYDILHPWDIIEDIAIGYGYDRITPVIPGTMGIGEVHPMEERKIAVRAIMTGLGYLEVLTFTLTSERKQFGLMKRSGREVEKVTVASPISTEHTMLRSSILPNLLEILSINTHRDLPQRIFEVGQVLLKFEERYMLAAVSTHAHANFAEVKSVVEAVLKELGMADTTVVDSEDGAFLDGRRADIIHGNQPIGVFGELHPEVILNFGLEHPVVGFEMDIGNSNAGKRGDK
ncbi:MAG: phenylalanine--tRNA ligase subunit beta [Methanophagales archaeon ANME-1-THS]|nr:MAG: phenylalanine--tRNA ligase subunit beta [Methanophagales archaeon ANME-1-THS]